MNTDTEVIVALDRMSLAASLSLAEQLQNHVWGFKVNDLVFEDLSCIEKLKSYGNVFVDSKLHDIPNTVHNCVERLVGQGADMITVHTLGGVEMMQAAKQAAQHTQIIGVTVLTSDAKTDTVVEDVCMRAKSAFTAGLDGVVCSGKEITAVKALDESAGKLIVTPGIRPSWHTTTDDQKRIVSAHEAKQSGATHLVVGRPITESRDPLQALQNLFIE